MNDIIGIILVAATVLCMYLAQRKAAPKTSQRAWSILGGAASAMVALEAMQRSEPGVFIIFALAAGISLFTVVRSLKPASPDA